MMHNDTRRDLLALESVDVVRDWHKSIAGRELNARRANEITSSAKQAREYFRNAASADDVVRPLLTFYGIASLARSVVLLLRVRSGEESLARGHGLECLGWSNTLSGEIPVALSNLGAITVRTTNGLFQELLSETANRICIHVRSSTVDWRLAYDQPPAGAEFALEDVLTRIPDLSKPLSHSQRAFRCAAVNEMTYSDAAGYFARIQANQFVLFEATYVSAGFQTTPASNGSLTDMRCSTDTFANFTPQFMHTYVNKLFESIPGLHVVDPFGNGARLSQLGVTYLLSYFLGMLTRYFPTHWVALHRGSPGDRLWPVIHAGQEYVESSFPELAIEFIHDTVAQGK